jgi:hypothetical protein
MTMSSKLPWIIGGGAAVAYLWSRSRRGKAASAASIGDQTSPTAAPLPGRWVWPVPTWNGRKPDVSSGWGSPRGNGTHAGVDIMYHRAPNDPYKVGSPNGSKGYVMPENTPALAASDGVVWSAGWTPRGYAVVIDHGAQSKVATFCNHLSSLLVTTTERGKSGQRVVAGQPLGIIGANPLDREKLMHLHFALWRGGPKDAVDPKPVMSGWEMVSPPPRNAGLAYRPIGRHREPYPDWIRNLDAKSGVYVIREGGEVVYVGESHTGRLYDTLTRHFSVWRRWKGFWRDQFGEGHDPGMTYDRDRVEVAVRVTSPSAAIDEEARLIRRLKPRDNLLGQSEDVIPF